MKTMDYFTMPQSLSNVCIHIIFSTRNRAPLIAKEIQLPLHAYLATIIRNLNCECYRAGGVEDHVHLAIRLARTMVISNLVEKVKTGSSKWLKKQSPELETFYWQRGYAALSVSPQDIPPLCDYIDSQSIHHRKVSFQDEYRSLLDEYGITYDEQYMWD